MKGLWKVTSNFIGDTKKYAVYRILDTGETDHSGNREYATEWLDDREQAAKIARELNTLERDSGQ